MLVGPLNPAISDSLTTAPEVVNSPTVPLPAFATNTLFLEIAIPPGAFKTYDPEMTEALITDPSGPYSPMAVPPPFATYKFCALRVPAKPHVSATANP